MDDLATIKWPTSLGLAITFHQTGCHRLPVLQAEPSNPRLADWSADRLANVAAVCIVLALLCLERLHAAEQFSFCHCRILLFQTLAIWHRLEQVGSSHPYRPRTWTK